MVSRLVAGAAALVLLTPPDAQVQTTPITFGETFTMPSKALGEPRRINVYVPPAYGEAADARRPVLYMPDGGMAEDFLHIAGLLQVSAGNGTVKPMILVGIENTERRRDLSGPTNNPEDRKIAPRVGGSAAFRTFLRTELIPLVNARYRTTAARAIIGESLAGLFTVETFFLEPGLFDTYIAFDASLWWNNGDLVKQAPARLASMKEKTSLYLASSSEDRDDLNAALAKVLEQHAPAGLAWHFAPMPGEKHATIYHPAALEALRRLFKP
jgi:predicted alpha/beta superfamily hydrolase